MVQKQRKKYERHGEARRDWKAPEYTIWVGMRQRCSNPRAASYEDYGGRGISVCKRWQESYAAFLEDMGRRPSPLHSIHRKDNDGNYTPDNCVWATNAVQARSKRSNNNITAFGVTRCITDWAADLGVQPSAIAQRIRNGWMPEDAVSLVSTKANDQRRLLTVDGDVMLLPAWAALSGVPATTIWHRVTKMGWEHKEAIFTPAGIAKVGRKPSTALTVNGETLPIEEWAEKAGLNRTTIDERLKRGWSKEDAVLLPVGERTGRGATNGNARLTALQVSKIRAHLTKKSDRQLARDFGVSKTTIGHIRKGLTWK